MAKTSPTANKGDMRILKTKIGSSLIPNRADRESATSDIYVKTADGNYVAVEVKGQASIVGEDYLYLSVMKPLSILAKIDGERAKIITDDDAKAVAEAQKGLAELTARPATPRANTRPTVSADIETLFSAQIKAFEQENPGYTLDFKGGTPVAKRITTRKAAAK